MSSDSGTGRHKPRRKATRARGSRPATSEVPPPPPEPPRYAPRDGESPFWANARTDSQAWADTQAHLEARRDTTPQYAPRPNTPDVGRTGSSYDASRGTTPLGSGSAGTSSGGWVAQSTASTPLVAPDSTPTPRTAAAPIRRTRQSTPAEDLAGLGAWATTPPARPASSPQPEPTRVGWTPDAAARTTPTEPPRPTTESPRPAASTAATAEALAPATDSPRAGWTPTVESAPAEPESEWAASARTAAASDETYVQPPAAAVADPRTARSTSELSGPRTAAARPRPRQAADSAALDDNGRPTRPAGKRRPVLAVAVVLLVLTPISWLLLHQPSPDEAADRLPISIDDSYATPTTKPVDSPTTRPTAPPKTPPTATPTSTPTGTPTNSTTPTVPPTGGPTDVPTSAPTETSSSTTPSVPNPTSPPTSNPTNTPPPPPPPPPKADGEMNPEEVDLFNRIDSARKSKGCGPLEQDPAITRDARSDATQRSKSDNNLNEGGARMSAAGGDRWSAADAYDQMMTQSKPTLLNCGLDTLAIGHYQRPYCANRVLGICLRTEKRDSWVAYFE